MDRFPRPPSDMCIVYKLIEDEMRNGVCRRRREIGLQMGVKSLERTKPDQIRGCN